MEIKSGGSDTAFHLHINKAAYFSKSFMQLIRNRKTEPPSLGATFTCLSKDRFL